MNGEVIRQKKYREGSFSGEINCDVLAETNGWIAARCSGVARDSFDQAIYAHTSPVWLEMGRLPTERKNDAKFFAQSIEQSLQWINRSGRYTNTDQRQAVAELFRKGQKVYEGLLSS